MSNAIRITKEMDIRVLTFQGLEDEYYQGIPEAWVECFGMGNANNPETPTFNQILYLRNVNIRPTVSGPMEMFLPIWHAAAITFMDDEPVAIILISDVELMDKLIRQHPPEIILKATYPEASPHKFRADLIDAEQEAVNNQAGGDTPIIVLEGWPKESLREGYLRQKQLVEDIGKATGNGGQVDFGYHLSIDGVEIDLHFVYLILNVPRSEYWWIQHDVMLPEVEEE